MAIAFLVAGLGNPGPRYEGTRHNAGFLVVDELYRRTRQPGGWRERFGGLAALVDWGDETALAVKPQTYMNRSGQCVQALLAFYKLGKDRLIVVHDELDLPFGELRLKLGGGDGGHNGVKSITAQLGGAEYSRLRFGIGRPPPEFAGDAAGFVLEAFAAAERADLDNLVARAADALTLVARVGLDAAMNQVNRRTKG